MVQLRCQIFRTDTELVFPVNVSCINHKYGELVAQIPAKCLITGVEAHYECTKEECAAVIDGTTDGHAFEWKTDKPATEDETGLRHEECSVGGYAKAAVETPMLDHVHTMVHHDAVSANCQANGNIEYWTCSIEKCASVYYTNAEVTETATNIVITAPDTHVGGTYKADQKEATCLEEGYTGDTYCGGCNTMLETGSVIEKNADNPAAVWSTDADYHWKECQTVDCGNVIDKAVHTGGESTCVKKAICSVCGVEYGTVNADNHINTEIINAKEATEEEVGYTGDTYCKDCEKIIKSGTEIARLDHTHNMMFVPAKEGTPEVDGNIEYWTCDKCHKSFSDETGTTEITAEDIVTRYDNTFVLGDVNDDGRVTTKDIIVTMKYILNKPPKEYNEKAADFNEDGRITVRDIIEIMKKLIKK